MTQGRVTHAEADGIHVLRYFGRVNFMLAPGIQRFVERLLAHGAVSGLVFDLTSAESLDSTNLGLMARVNEWFLRAGAANSVIVSTNEEIDVVLRSMGFDQTFELLAETNGSHGSNAGTRSIEMAAPSSPELRRTMIDAHYALIRMSDAGRMAFEPVVACLEQDAETRASGSTPENSLA